jgi:hypothetical protein
MTISDEYTKNYDALTSTTKGGAPPSQIMWCAVALTIFTIAVSLAKSQPSK